LKNYNKSSTSNVEEMLSTWTKM